MAMIVVVMVVIADVSLFDLADGFGNLLGETRNGVCVLLLARSFGQANHSISGFVDLDVERDGAHVFLSTLAR